MKYTFQDSTEFPVQRDFIQDIQDFIRISKEVIPLEKSIKEIKQVNIEETGTTQAGIEEIDRFQKEITECIEERALGYESREVLEIKSKTIETCANISLLKKNEKLEDIDKQNRLALIEVRQLEDRILTALSPFFENSIYGAEHTCYASSEDRKLKGWQVSSIDGMRYEFELSFIQDTLKVEDLLKLTLPVRSKSGFLSKEEKVKKLDVSGFYVTNIEHGKNTTRTVIEDKDAENRFIITSDGGTFLIMYGDNEITGDEKLAPALDKDSISIFVEKIKDFVTDSVVFRKLRLILIDGKNAVEENVIFDCLKIIAGIYGKLAKECIERGYTEGEITIKIEEPGSIRTEKYISKSEASSELSSIGPEGNELARILRVSEA
ncbi:hypothetical protein [Methanosarcina mazei]|jgi:hypothetical protein|uniref:Chromosome segregation ATPase n=7 Tax=Methanosarcina mazei TaxID=2209 RepID=A0A0F8UUQ3_METMZ|nr:hypothetical protein [Methanosarcina mazei]AAM29915.1 conserved protein [Methanosarcina mazei Go1]AGF95674.1 Chromosome segregation ATPase [Methanosarcina mazei Tuc01]AKB61012.1 Chromosome segregation ATPase [Methanosarcina mazei SarPi]AKB64277.1 Chromosome segregation ATPase [Methanosarcina mazei S-6]AKB67634.1 Chromosome segregation ATPase [Methanosarcina mazei LYC]